ncbi:MAG TPA: hypothetical protein VEA61_10670 [Allosphingosinicella sp.]|nr:hypothetical protein [Allosphingosinicella sp.]
MSPLLALHIAGGLAALLAGTVAVAARKGSPLHARAGTGFAVAMLVLGLTAAILARLKAEPESGLGGLLTCYFVATSWVAARRRDGSTGRFEIVACALALGAGAITAWAGITGAAATPAGAGPAIAFGGICLLAGLLDLNAILRRALTPAQRLARHLWRMCVALFIATGSFFLGQQDVLAEAVRGSPVLFVLAFAPFAVMLFWLVRLRFAGPLRRIAESLQRRSGSALAQ